jgi:ribonucleoside-diphosphate reductase alpha chain
MAKEGSTVSGLMDSLATMTSISLQYGVPLRDLVNKFSHMRFEPAGFTGNAEIPIAKSIVDYIFRWMGSRFLPKDDRDALGIITRDDSPAVAGSPEGSSASATGFASLAAPAADASGAPETSTPTPGAASSAPSSGVSEGLNTGEVGGPKTTAVSTVTPPVGTSAGAADLPVQSNGHTNGNGNGHTKAVLPIKPIDLGGGTKVAFSVSADSPSCADCGSIMVRNGSCYKCLNCGSTSGCS